MRLRALPFVAVLAVMALPVAPASAATHHKAQVRQFKGTVAAVSADFKTVRLKRSRHASVKFTLARSTRVAGAKRSALAKGQRATIRARRTRHGWVASRIAVTSKPRPDSDPANDDGSADTDPLDDDTDQADQNDDAGGDYADDPGADDPGDDDPADDDSGDDDSGY